MNENLWLNESNPVYGSKRMPPPSWLPIEHRARWERLRQLRMLFEGKHRCYYLDEARTQFNYPDAEIQGETVRPYHDFNLLKLVAVKTADLLFGTKVRLTAPSKVQADKLDELARRSILHSRLHGTMVRCSWAGGAFQESLIWRGEPYIVNVEPDEIFPLGPVMPNGQYERYLRFATANIGTADKPIVLLLTTEFQPDRIVRQLIELGEDGRSVRDRPLADWPQFSKETPAVQEVTGVKENTITYIPNELGGVLEVSDFDGLIGLQDTVNGKIAQMARVISQHADPKLAMPQHTADADGDIRSTKNLFYFQNKDEIPQYIVWSAELDAADRDVMRAIDRLCIAAEMSQVLLGLKQGAAPTAARTLRLEATNSLAKVGRKALLVEPAIARAIEVAQRLDQTTSLRRSYPVDAIGVEPRDGLPIDELDEANIIATLRGAKAMSLEAAVERRVEDADAAAEEVKRIQDEIADEVASSQSNVLGDLATGDNNIDTQTGEAA